MEERDQVVRLTIGPGTLVIPAWLGGLVVLAFLFSALSLLLLWNTNQNLEREIRILQLHVADIENVLIRKGVADRSDFADWEESSAPNNSRQEKGETP